MKYMNVPDIVMITLSAYLVIWGANYILRTTGMGAFQA